jgi:hypothetical protein
MRWLTLLIASQIAGSAFALGPTYFGAEFTFFNPQTGNRVGTNRLVQRLRDHLVKNQLDGAKFIEDHYLDEDVDYDSVPNGEYAGRDVSPSEMTSLSTGRFTSPSGWWFEWGLDDGVVEIKTKPMTLEEFRQYQGDMQDAIFVSAANEGLWPPAFLGGGHINLSMSTFKGNDLLLRNFFVDFLNHNELFMGIFNYDTHNSASICVQSSTVQKQVRSVIGKFDAGGFQGIEHSQEKFLREIQAALNLTGDDCLTEWNKNEPPGEDSSSRQTYFAVNFFHVVPNMPYSRIEIRAVRAQQSMDMWIRQIELFQKRLEYLEKIVKPIALKRRVPVEKIDIEHKKHHLNPPIQAQEALRSFYIYVTESGLRWQNHRDYLWPAWIQAGEVERFENSRWFTEREGSCAKLLIR